MAHLFKPQIVRWVDADGKRVPKNSPGAVKIKERSRKWYGKGAPLPKGKKVPLASDKTAASQMLADLVKSAERGGAGIGGPEVEASRRPLAEHLGDYLAFLRSKDDSDQHVELTAQRIRDICAACDFEHPPDLSASAVSEYLAGRRKLPRKDGGLSVASSNYYLTAIKGFGRWLVRDRRLDVNPLAYLQGGNVKTDRRHDRRALPPEQLVQLLTATRESVITFRGLAGRDRLMLYLTACGTGFRAGELAVLLPEWFRLDDVPPAVQLRASDDKAGRAVTQPIAPGLVEALREYLAGKPASAPVWGGTWPEKGAKMLRLDLEAAGIPYAVEGPDGPLYADFHALRHSFVALLDQAGVSLKQAMQLARHSDPKLTMARYGRAQLADLGAAVGRLPELTALPAAPSRPSAAAASALDELPVEVLRALAIVGLAAIAGGLVDFGS